MKLNIILFTAVIFVFSFWGCDEEEIETFSSDDAGIYFQRVSSYVLGGTTEYYADSLVYSFASADADTKVLHCRQRCGQWESG